MVLRLKRSHLSDSESLKKAFMEHQRLRMLWSKTIRSICHSYRIDGTINTGATRSYTCLLQLKIRGKFPPPLSHWQQSKCFLLNLATRGTAVQSVNQTAFRWVQCQAVLRLAFWLADTIKWMGSMWYWHGHSDREILDKICETWGIFSLKEHPEKALIELHCLVFYLPFPVFLWTCFCFVDTCQLVMILGSRSV